MVSAAKSQPGKLTYATPGVGTPHQLSMALFMQSTGTEMLHVPYKGTAGAVTDLLGGRIDFMFLPAHVALQHIQAGKLVPIAVTTPARAPQLPEVPTIAETVVPGYGAYGWTGLCGPAGLPAEVVRKVNADVTAILREPAVAARFLELGGTATPTTPEEFGEFVRREIAQWREVARLAGVRLEG